MLTVTDEMKAAASTVRTAVQLDGVTKRFGALTALHEAWLKIAPGEFMTLLGPSGCGKTTLLNLIAGFLQADGGEIFIDGSLVTNTPAHKREIGIVFQNYALFPHMSVAKNTAYGLKTRGLPSAEIAQRVQAALSLVKLTSFGDRRPRELSGGQQQRVALARALVIRPKVLLLDEPFSALDKHLRASIQVELKEIQRELGVTTIFVTHDQGEALAMSDCIAVMSAGRIRQVGGPDEIYRRPADPFVASFVGDVNRFKGRLEAVEGPLATVRACGLSISAPSAPLSGLSVGDAVEVFARPEHFHIAGPDAGDVLRGCVAAQVFQGPHVDLYVDVPALSAARVLVRATSTAATSWTAGAPIGLSLASADIAAFPPEGGA